MVTKPKIWVFYGRSGAGKNYCAFTMKEFERKKYVLSYTTRPKRPNEEDGVDYYFQDVPEDKTIMIQNEYNGWKYTTCYEDLAEDNVLIVGFQALAQLEKLRKQGKIDVRWCHVVADEQIREKRVLSRGGADSWRRRRQADHDDIMKCWLPQPDFIIDNNKKKPKIRKAIYNNI